MRKGIKKRKKYLIIHGWESREQYENENYYFGDRKLRMCCHPRWPALELRAAIVSYINSSFLAKFRFRSVKRVHEEMLHC